MYRLSKNNLKPAQKRQGRKANCPFHHSILAYIHSNACIDRFLALNRKTDDFIYAPIPIKKTLVKNLDGGLDRKSRLDVKISTKTGLASYSSSAYTINTNEKSLDKLGKSVSLINVRNKSPYLKEQTIFIRNEPLDRTKYRIPSLSPPKRRAFDEKSNRSKSCDPQKSRLPSRNLIENPKMNLKRAKSQRITRNSSSAKLLQLNNKKNDSVNNLKKENPQNKLKGNGKKQNNHIGPVQNFSMMKLKVEQTKSNF
jgi:hypothetical protein